MDAELVGSWTKEVGCIMDGLVGDTKLVSVDGQCARRLQEVDLVEKQEEKCND